MPNYSIIKLNANGIWETTPLFPKKEVYLQTNFILDKEYFDHLLNYTLSPRLAMPRKTLKRHTDYHTELLAPKANTWLEMGGKIRMELQNASHKKPLTFIAFQSQRIPEHIVIERLALSINIATTRNLINLWKVHRWEIESLYLSQHYHPHPCIKEILAFLAGKQNPITRNLKTLVLCFGTHISNDKITDQTYIESLFEEYFPFLKEIVLNSPNKIKFRIRNASGSFLQFFIPNTGDTDILDNGMHQDKSNGSCSQEITHSKGKEFMEEENFSFHSPTDQLLSWMQYKRKHPWGLITAPVPKRVFRTQSEGCNLEEQILDSVASIEEESKELLQFSPYI